MSSNNALVISGLNYGSKKDGDGFDYLEILSDFVSGRLIGLSEEMKNICQSITHLILAGDSLAELERSDDSQRVNLFIFEG